ncbi:unnamed protein product [Anisakis simplex]|uniref:Acyl_transf_3 domain-containing protein n=1 Tax=Anisakis simplex TaxID=6269 RepID=A0A0M3K6S7_ANISI|nr:unnamed protein product [Anisakis simplex]
MQSNNIFSQKDSQKNRFLPCRYIGTEFIFFLITPIFLLSLKRSFSLGLLISIACIFASVALNLKTSIDYNFPPTQMLWTKPAIFNQDFMQHHRLVYIKPQYRIGPYLIGLLLGYILTLPCQRNQKYTKKFICIGWTLAVVFASGIKNIRKNSFASDGRLPLCLHCHLCQHNQKYTKKFICIGWTLAVVFALSSLFGLYPALQGWKWPMYHLIYGATHRLLWALAMGWIIYACHNRIGGLVDTILSSRIFLPFAGLGYSVGLPVLFLTGFILHFTNVFGFILGEEYFINSYAVGEQQSYLNRDRSRWVCHYRFMECIHAAGESEAVASEYPMIFCSGRIQTNGTIGGICLPSPCTNDRDELLRVWNEKAKGGKDIEVEDVECTISRYEKQWYEIMSCVLEFSSNKVLMCVVAFATIYHIQRGDQANSLFLRLFLAFSAKSSIQSITSFPKDENATIKCIVGLRVLATIWVIAGHTSIFIEVIHDIIQESVYAQPQ